MSFLFRTCHSRGSFLGTFFAKFNWKIRQLLYCSKQYWIYKTYMPTAKIKRRKT